MPLRNDGPDIITKDDRKAIAREEAKRKSAAAARKRRAREIQAAAAERERHEQSKLPSAPAAPPARGRPRADIAPVSKPKPAKKVVVKKKAPPITVPSLDAAWRTPEPAPPKPRKPTIVDRKPKAPEREHRIHTERAQRAARGPAHVPIQYRYVSPEKIVLEAMGKLTQKELDDIQRYNQQRERGRRADAKAEAAARKARRALVRNMSEDARDAIGKDKLRAYVETGESPADGPGFFDIAGTVARGALNAGGDLVEDFTTRLRSGLAGRESGREYTAGDDPFLNAVGEIGLGENIVKALKGEDYSRGMLGAELGLLFIPVRGLPTPLTSLLRSVYGAKAYARAVAEGDTVAGMVKKLGSESGALNVPVRTRKAQKRMDLRKAAAEAGEEAPPMASSWLAGKLAGQRMDPVSKFIRNDPRTKRTFVKNGQEEYLDADLSRTWKFFVRPALDAARKRTGTRLPLRAATAGVYKTENEMFLRALKRRLDHDAKRYQGRVFTLTKSAKDVPDVAHYVARSVLRNVPIEKMVETLRQSADEARAAGEWLQVRALEDQILFTEGAAKYLTKDADGNVVLAGDAPAAFQTFIDEIAETSKTREGILDELDELAPERARLRLLNEQLMYHGARLQPTDPWARRAYEENDVYRDIAKGLRERYSPEEVDFTLTLVEAMARRHFEETRANLLALSKKLQAEGRHHSARQVENRARTLEADDFFDHVDAVSEVVPKHIADAIRHKHGSVNPEITPFHSFASERTDGHLAAKLAGQPEGLGDVQNPVVYGDYNGTQVALFGDITPEDWVTRVLATMPTPEERAEWAAWYRSFEPSFRAVFGDDADALMRAFAVSQANTSPADGLQAVFKILDDLRQGIKVEVDMVQARSKETGEPLFLKNGEPKMRPQTVASYPDGTRVPRGYGSVVADNIAKAIENGEINSGLAAKLSDFIDSLIGSETRTWMGHHKQGGRPVAADVHAARDRGFIDPKLLTEGGKKSPYYDAMKGAVVDNPAGSPSGHSYERTAEWYERLTDHLNEIKFDGRDDWIPSEVQAVGWASIQKLHGRNPQDFGIALRRNTYSLGFEASDDMTAEQAKAFFEAELPAIKEMVAEEGLFFRGFETGVSRWEGQVNGSARLDVIGSREKAVALINKIAQAFDQGLVQGFREVDGKSVKGQKVHAALTVSSKAFEDDALRIDFAERLGAKVKLLKDSGSMPDTLGDTPAFTIITSRNGVDDKTRGSFEALFRKAIDEVEQEMGLDDVRYGARNFETHIGDQVGPASFDNTTGEARRLPLEDLDPRTAAIRSRLQAEVGRLLGSVDDGVQSQIDAVEKQLDELIRTRAAENGGTRGLLATGGRATGSGRRYEEGIGRRGAIGGRAGDFDEAEAARRATRPATERKQPHQIARDIAERQLIEEGHPEYARLSDELSALRAQREASYPDWARFDESGGVLRGVWDNESKVLYYPPEAHPSTYVHELFHVIQSENLMPPKVAEGLWKFVGATPGEKLTVEQSEDMVDILLGAMVGAYRGQASQLPAPIRAAYEAMGKSIQAKGGSALDRANKMLATLPEELRLGVEDAIWYKNTGQADRFLGAKNFARGTRDPVYVPESPGLPFSFIGPRRVGALWMRLRKGKQVTDLTPVDEHLRRTYSGALTRSGQWDKSVIKGPLEGLLKAVEMERMKATRDALIPAANDIPTTAGDIAILTDPEEWTSESHGALRRALALFNEMQPNKQITAEQLYKIDARGLDEAKLTMYPNLDPKSDGAEVWGSIADEVRRTQTPIPGVKWVSRSELEQAGIPGVPNVKIGDNVWGNRIVNSFDFLNNYAKLMTLSLNPAYYPMNMAGQAVMGLVQQGAFFPYSLLRSMHIAHDLGEAVNLIDVYSGAGLASVVRGRGYGAEFTDAVGEVSRFLIDRYPRRAAFLYEARRLGYKTNAEVLELLTNPGNPDLLTIASRAKSAMVDFGDMSRVEREWITRIIFVYPWLKGSAKWTGQFVADHPFQTALFAGLLWWQQDRLNTAFPDDTPGYLKWFFPIQLPEDGGSAYGFRMEQMFTPLQPIDLFIDAAYLTQLGDLLGLDIAANEEGASAKLNPLLEEIAKTVMGYDPFTRREVSHSLLNFLRRLAPDERWASMKRVMKIVHRQEHEGIYDTNQFQNWLRLALGGLAPIDVNPDEAAEAAVPEKLISVPDVPPETRLEDKFEEAKELAAAAGDPLPPEKEAEIKELFRKGQVAEQAESEYRKANGISFDIGMTPQRRLAALILAFIMLNPDKESIMRPKMEAVLQLTDEEAEAEIAVGRERMGLTKLSSIEDKIGKLRTAADEANR